MRLCDVCDPHTVDFGFDMPDQQGRWLVYKSGDAFDAGESELEEIIIKKTTTWQRCPDCNGQGSYPVIRYVIESERVQATVRDQGLARKWVLEAYKDMFLYDAHAEYMAELRSERMCHPWFNG